jgi:Fe-S-cluster containining protein
MKSSIHIVDVDRLDTWSRYRPGLCDSCVANCCTMPLEVRLSDLVRLGWVDAFEAEHEAPKQIAKRLMAAKQIEHFNFRHSIFTVARRASGDCQMLDAVTRRCTVYAQRPDTCRKHPQVGPRPGHCPYGAKTAPRGDRRGALD